MSDPVFEIRVRVYFEDTDALGVVYYANYLKFMERARSDWLRSRAPAQAGLGQGSGIVFVVTRLDVRYLKPARLDDELYVSLRPTRMGRAGFDVQQWVQRAAIGGERATLTSAKVRIGCIDSQTMTPRRIPDSLLMELQVDH